MKTKQTILREAARLVLDPEFKYDWINAASCIIGAIYQATTGKRYEGWIGCWGTAILNFKSDPDEESKVGATLAPMLAAGFTLDELFDAEMCGLEGQPNDDGQYKDAAYAAGYLNSWAEQVK